MKVAALCSLPILLCPLLARAVDPQCVDPVVADPAVIYNGTNGLRFCTPIHDVDGDPLAAGELERCVVLADGALYASVLTTTPGSYFVVPPPTKGAKRRAVSAYCEGQGGKGPEGPLYDTLLRRMAPGKPLVLP